MIEWHIEKRKIADLKPHDKNPRKLSKHDAKHLEESLTKFGLADKPIINTDGTVIGGHQRLNILKKLKVNEIECWVPNDTMSNEDVDELNIRLNRNNGEWDWDILSNEWDVDLLQLWGFTADDFGLEKEEDKPTKAKVIFEFHSRNELEEAMPRLEDIAIDTNAVMRVK